MRITTDEEKGKERKRGVMGKHGSYVYSGEERLGSALDILADSMMVFHVAWHG